MRFATTLFAALMLAGALANDARAQPGITTPTFGPYSVSGPGQTYGRDSNYTGPYSVYGPGLTYRPLDYTGPYSGRLGSTASLAPTRTTSDPALRTAERMPATGGEPGVRRHRYVRLSIAGNTVQAIVIP